MLSQSWKLGRLGIGGLDTSDIADCNMLYEKLVEGFEVNIISSKPNCTACIGVKQSVKPFNASVTHQTDLGQLTHINV